MSQEGDVLKKPGKIWREGLWTRYDHDMIFNVYSFQKTNKMNNFNSILCLKNFWFIWLFQYVKIVRFVDWKLLEDMQNRHFLCQLILYCAF